MSNQLHTFNGLHDAPECTVRRRCTLATGWHAFVTMDWPGVLRSRTGFWPGGLARGLALECFGRTRLLLSHESSRVGHVCRRAAVRNVALNLPMATRVALRPDRCRILLGGLCMALALVSAPHAMADEAPKHPCARVRDAAARLACYDEAFGKPPLPIESEQFGLTPDQIERARPAAERAAADVQKLTATVTAVEYRGNGRFVATLDNGQLWSQVETNTKVRVAIGDSVTVRRAALGSYLLTSGRGIATRVRRVR